MLLRHSASRVIAYGFLTGFSLTAGTIGVASPIIWHLNSISNRRIQLANSTSWFSTRLTTEEQCVEFCKKASQIEFDNTHFVRYALSRVTKGWYTMPEAPQPWRCKHQYYYAPLSYEERQLLRKLNLVEKPF